MTARYCVRCRAVVEMADWAVSVYVQPGGDTREGWYHHECLEAAAAECGATVEPLTDEQMQRDREWREAVAEPPIDPPPATPR